MTYNPEYGNFHNRMFKEVFPETRALIEGFQSSDLANIDGIPTLNEDELSITYALLYARYGNSVIASYDESQFRYKIYSTIFMYGPTWAKRLEIQNKLRHLQETDLQTGSKQILNTALNPGTAPSTGSLQELEYINQQNTSTNRRGKLDAYAYLLDLLKTDVSEEYIGRFKKHFITIVQPTSPLYYESINYEMEG